MILPRIKRILCLEDDQDDRELVSFMLRRINPNCEVVTVENVSSALIIIIRQSFDLFILDYTLAGVSGLEFCRWIRNADIDTPIVFFTGRAEPEIRQAAFEAGANAYLTKPADFEKFRETVEPFIKPPLKL